MHSCVTESARWPNIVRPTSDEPVRLDTALLNPHDRIEIHAIEFLCKVLSEGA